MANDKPLNCFYWPMHACAPDQTDIPIENYWAAIFQFTKSLCMLHCKLDQFTVTDINDLAFDSSYRCIALPFLLLKHALERGVFIPLQLGAFSPRVTDVWFRESGHRSAWRTFGGRFGRRGSCFCEKLNLAYSSGLHLGTVTTDSTTGTGLIFRTTFSKTQYNL